MTFLFSKIGISSETTLEMKAYLIYNKLHCKDSLATGIRNSTLNNNKHKPCLAPFKIESNRKSKQPADWLNSWTLLNTTLSIQNSSMLSWKTDRCSDPESTMKSWLQPKLSVRCACRVVNYQLIPSYNALAAMLLSIGNAIQGYLQISCSNATPALRKLLNIRLYVQYVFVREGWCFQLNFSQTIISLVVDSFRHLSYVKLI